MTDKPLARDEPRRTAAPTAIKPGRDPVLAGTARTRPCLMCGSGFASAWAGERICQSCRTTSLWRAGVRWPSGPVGAKRQ